MAREAGSDAGRLGRYRRRDLAEPPPATRRPGASDHAGGQRHTPAREPSARRTRGAARARVRAHRRAAQDSGRHRIDSGANCDQVRTELADGEAGTGEQRLWTTLVLTRQGETWKIDAIRNIAPRK